MSKIKSKQEEQKKNKVVNLLTGFSRVKSDIAKITAEHVVDDIPAPEFGDGKITTQIYRNKNIFAKIDNKIKQVLPYYTALYAIVIGTNSEPVPVLISQEPNDISDGFPLVDAKTFQRLRVEDCDFYVLQGDDFVPIAKPFSK
ncbi:TPA: hypothetical protein ACUU9M_004221 [Yersinia enterocolitica]|uniref:Uncharacterized protein n=1 Tax=Yersinia kristensenii TaxID=28152 RepID=A0AB73NRV9_YERKR|nr:MULTISPECIES: hypothetical protein [Yersinia]OVZ93844.1 hypothetical protein CBW53_21665 [Yersinia frederiksenii]HDL6649130.1 hypothetical protein [Yersinia enterocolitica]AUQ43854.1 hypothetical protein NJ56_17955 [Yersinia ruckeri]OVZ78388.1 hypothetical protein CBW52_18755 [Yersinia kristensenii]UIN19237.1 hypothetical protein LGL86_17595 [Yersinia ruckeri]